MRTEMMEDVRLNRRPFGFITAYKDACPLEENTKRNEQLEAEIKESGLSYVRASMIWELDQTCTTNIFCIDDNNFLPEDFRKLLVCWGDKYEQPCVLLTRRDHHLDEPYSEDDTAYGTYYDRDGEALHVARPVTVKDIDRYFSKIIHQYMNGASHVNFTLTETKFTGGNSFSFRASESLFKEKYPDLCKPREKRDQPWIKATRVQPKQPTEVDEKMTDHKSDRPAPIELPAEVERSVFRLVDSYEMRNFLKEMTNFNVYNWIELITGAPKPMDKKLQILTELAKVPMEEQERYYMDGCLKAGQTAMDRLYHMDPEKNMLLLDSFDTDSLDPFPGGTVEPFSSYDAVLEDIRYNYMDDDTLEDLAGEDDRQTLYFHLRLYEKKGGAFIERYQYTCTTDGKVQFYRKVETEEEEKGHRVKRWIERMDEPFAGRENLDDWETPFQPGDIVYVDMRPYFRPTYCLIYWVNEQMPFDCCGTQCLYVTPNGEISHGAFKHGWFLPHILVDNYDPIRPYFSPLYRAERYTGPLPEEYAFMKPLSERLKKDPSLSRKLDDYLMDRNNKDKHDTNFVYRPVPVEKKEYWEEDGNFEGVSREALFTALGIEEQEEL